MEVESDSMKLYCGQCDELVDVTVKKENEVIKVKSDEINVQVEIAFCDICGGQVCSEELDNKTLNIVYSTYRKNHNLLSPDQILRIRNKYFLSQRALAKLLEWGEMTEIDIEIKETLKEIIDYLNIEKVYTYDANLIGYLDKLIRKVNKEEL